MRLSQDTATRQHDVGIEKVVTKLKYNLCITRVWTMQIAVLKVVRIRGDVVCGKICCSSRGSKMCPKRLIKLKSCGSMDRAIKLLLG